MIGFDHIGNLGRLGNQMFEYAALRGIAENNGYDVCIPPADHEGIENYSLHECFDLDNISTGFINKERYAMEQTFHFNDELHITTGSYTTILEIAQNIQKLFSNIGKEVVIKPAESKDEVQKDARNIPDPYIKQFWKPKTSVKEGLKKVFEDMKNDWI